MHLYVSIRLLGHTWWHGCLASCFAGSSRSFIHSLFSSDVSWSRTCFILAADMYIKGVNPLIVSGNSGVAKNYTANRSSFVFHWKFLIISCTRISSPVEYVWASLKHWSLFCIGTYILILIPLMPRICKQKLGCSSIGWQAYICIPKWGIWTTRRNNAIKSTPMCSQCKAIK